MRIEQAICGPCAGVLADSVLAAPYAVHAKDDLAPGPGLAPALSQDEAVKRTLDRHPALRAAALEIDIEHARREAEAQSPPLAFEAEVEDVGGTGAVSGIDRAEVTLQLSRVIEQGDKAALRLEVGDRRVDQALVAREATALELTREATDRYIDVVVLQERLELARQAEQIASKTLEFVTARVQAGSTPLAEASIARVERSRADLARLSLASQLEAARIALANLWQASSPDFGRASADLFRLPELPPYESLEQRLSDNPDLLQRGAELQLLMAESRLASSQQEADISVAGGVKRLGETGDVGLVFSVNVPFGAASRAIPRVEETRLQSEQNPLRSDAQTIELRTTLSAVYNDLLFAEQAIKRLQDDIIPEAELAVRLYEDAYRIGSSTLLELTQARKELLALQAERVEAAGTYHSQRMDIEYLLGRSYMVNP